MILKRTDYYTLMHVYVYIKYYLKIFLEWLVCMSIYILTKDTQ